ncbi:MAG: hypothetical protein AB7K09_16475 [Planctomycetota bacterium]
MKALRIQFLVCPQRDFIGTRDELEPALLKEYEWAASDNFYRARNTTLRWEKPGDVVVPRNTQGVAVADEPIRDFWSLVKEKRKLHIGPEMVKRLRHDGGADDPFVRTVKRLYSGDTPVGDHLKVVIDEDWHPRSCGEFPIFGVHCVKGSEGAMLAGELQEYRWDNRTHVLRANSVNPAANPADYKALLEEVLAGEKPEYVKAGVMGVYTHIKVEYLAVALSTMWPWLKPDQIGICAPLCSSQTLDDHEVGLRKMQVLGFRVFKELDPYLEWLGAEIN